ncbi:MAG: hypothetical protein AB7S70_16620 [Hyphomicrobium sp.]|uniref:hypothetical protein n=1 Tax=Hyphomicrobium sp. TaxID=82 RepID=UPI003D12E30B
MLWIAGMALAVIAATIAAWQWDYLPREVIATGAVAMGDGKILKTRQFYRTTRHDTHKSAVPGPVKRIAAWEVQLPSGRWIDCDGDDCRAAAERAIK